MSIKRKVISTTLSFSLLFSSFAAAPLSLVDRFQSVGIYGDVNAAVYTPLEPIPQVVVDKMNSVASKFLPEDVAKIDAAQNAMANLSDVNVVLDNVWVNIENKIALSPDPSEYNLLTPVSILKLMRESALMTYADPSGIEALRVHPEHRPVMDQLGKLGSPDPENPIDLVPNDFVDFFYAVEKKVIEDAMANLDVQAMKTLIKGKVRLVLEDNTYKLSQIFNNIGITFAQLEDMKNRIHDAVDPNWEGYKGVSFAYARDGLTIQKTYAGYTKFFNPTFKVYDFTLPSGIPTFQWSKVSGDSDVEIATDGTVSIPLEAATGSTYTAEIKMTVVYTDRYGSVSKQLFSEEMTFTYLGVDLEPPTDPSLLEATDVTTNSVTLEWVESTDNVAVYGYKIWVDGVYYADAEFSPFILEGLEPGTDYVIKVSAIDYSDNESDFSNEITITTLDDTKDEGPTDLTATNITESSVDLDATPSISADDVKEYWIYQDGVKVATTTTLPFSITGLSPNSVYEFTMTTIDLDDKESEQSEKITVSTDVTAPTAPSGLKTEDVTGTSFTLNATTPGTDNLGVKEYEIYQDGVKIATTTTLPYTVSGLTPDQTYKFTIKTVDNAGNVSGASEELTVSTDVTGPTAPSGLKAEDVTGTSFTLNSTTPGTDNLGVKEYEIYQDGVKIATTTTLPYTVSGLTPNQTYKFTIKTVDGAGNVSDASEELTVSTDVTRPTAPSGLKAEDVTGTSFTLNATTPGTDNLGVKEYEIYRDGVKIATTTTLPYTVSGLTPNQTYKFTIKTVDGAGNVSGASEELTVSTDVTKPAAPSGLKTEDVTPTSLKLNATNPGTDNLGVKEYEIYRDGVKIATTTTLPYQISGLSQKTVYKFTIKTVDNSGNVSDLSETIEVMTGPDTITEVTKPNVDTLNSNATTSLNNLKNQLKSEPNADKQKEFKKQIQDGFASFMQNAAKFIALPSISGNNVTIDTERLLFDGDYVFGKIKDLKNSMKPEVEDARLTTAIHVDLGTVNLNNPNVKLTKELFAGLRNKNIQTLNVTVNGMTVSIPTANINADFSFSVNKQTVANYLADKSTTFKTNMNRYSKMVYSDVYTAKVTSNLPAGTIIPLTIKIPAPPAADTEILTLIKIVDGNRKTIPAPVKDNFVEKEVDLINNVADSFAVLYNKVTFKDLAPVAKWAGREIEVMASKGVMDGRGNQIFDPRAYTTRAEFSKMLVLSFDLIDEKAQVNYKDLVNSKNKWFYVYVASAAKLGIVTGRTNGNFDPNMNMTREEMAAMIARTLKVVEKRMIVDKPADVLKQFKDGTRIAPFAQEPIASLVTLGILKGSNGNFIPRGKATRAETAVATYRLFQFNNLN